MRPLHLALALALAALSVSGCASTTLIQSQPTNARVYIDGEFVGKTPYAMTNTKVTNSGTAVHLEAPGYRPLDATIVRNGDIAVGPMVAGCILIVPLLWAKDYPAHSNLELAEGSYLAYYVDKLTKPGEPRPALAVPSGPPQVVYGEDEGKDAAAMRAKGFVEMGEAAFNDGDMTKSENEELARGAAIQKRAAAVLLYGKYAGTVTNQVPVTLTNRSVTTWTRPDRNGNPVDRSRQTDK